MANSMLRKTIISLLALCAFTCVAEPSVVVQTPWTAPFEYQYHTVGTLKSRYVIEYKVQTDGRVESVLTPGTNIAAGDTLVRQSDPLKQLALERSELVSLELAASRDLAQLQVDNLDVLVRSNNVSSQEAQAHRLKLVKAQAALNAQRSQAKQLLQSLAFLVTQAVRPGIVVEQHANIGEFVEKGDSLLTTIDMSAVQYWVTLPLEQAAQVNEHTRVTPIFDEKALPIAAVIPSGKTSVSLLTSVFDVSHRPIGHLATQAVVVTFRADEPLQWFHRDGIVDSGGVSQVKVIDSQGQVVERSVVIAAEKGEFIGVAGQLHMGDKIILRGMDGLSIGSEVHIKADRTRDLRKQFADVGMLSGGRQTW